MTDRFTRGFDLRRHKGFRVGTLWCDMWDADGDVTLSSEFDEMSDVARMDILNDFIGLLEKERDILRAEMYPESVKQNATA